MEQQKLMMNQNLRKKKSRNTMRSIIESTMTKLRRSVQMCNIAKIDMKVWCTKTLGNKKLRELTKKENNLNNKK